MIFIYGLVEQLSNTLLYASKEGQGHLVEWVEKSFFTRLNKLFEIDQLE